MKKLGRLDNAVEVSDEQGGYVALLNVFHELHCLVSRRTFNILLATCRNEKSSVRTLLIDTITLNQQQKLIRWSLYPDYFYPNSSEADALERERHRGKLAKSSMHSYQIIRL